MDISYRRGEKQFVGGGEWAVSFGLGLCMVRVWGIRVIGTFPPRTGTPMETAPSSQHARESVGTIGADKNSSKASKMAHMMSSLTMIFFKQDMADKIKKGDNMLHVSMS